MCARPKNVHPLQKWLRQEFSHFPTWHGCEVWPRNHEPNDYLAFFRQVAEALLSRNISNLQPTFIWRETSPRRFNSSGGYFNKTEGPCVPHELAKMSAYDWRNNMLRPILQRLFDAPNANAYGLPIWHLSAAAPFLGHGHDCSHYDLPGVPDTWSHSFSTLSLLATCLRMGPDTTSVTMCFQAGRRTSSAVSQTGGHDQRVPRGRRQPLLSSSPRTAPGWVAYSGGSI